ncbi:MAG: glycosyltransferase family 39 protein [Elusimicrobia bacterium]|nr:glycosyltransferase family 39 protein [Elusimicrobiota bacterium]
MKLSPVEFLRRCPKPFLLIVSAGLLLRLAGIDFGLPGTYHPDEPHHINLAVYFGSGDFNPHVFKYPTLWMYVLFILYGLFFVVWSGFGFLRGADDFGALFVWDPSAFYLIARGASAFLGAAAIFPLYAMVKRLAGERAGLLAAGLWAVSPRLVNYGHVAKPDMLMLAFSTLAWFLCARILNGARDRRSYVLAGGAMGLACSSQYTAGFIAPLLVLAHGLSQGRSWLRASALAPLVLGYAAAVAAFFLGTPFALFDFQTFARDLRDLLSYGQGALTGTPEKAGLAAAANLLVVLGWPALLGALIVAAGAVLAWRKNRRAALFGLLPLALGFVVMAVQSRQAAAERYVAALFPGVVLLASFAAEAPWLKTVKAAAKNWWWLLLIPGAWGAVGISRDYLKPDTRTLAKEWIEEHIPEGSRILLDQIYLGPPLAMTKDQVERLYQKTSSIGHPRARYFHLMLKGHPGGGYEILRMLRTSGELISMERHTQWSQQGYDLLDVERGLPALQEAGVRYALTSSEGARADTNPRLSKFFSDLESKTELLRQFQPDDRTTGPALKIYRVFRR